MSPRTPHPQRRSRFHRVVRLFSCGLLAAASLLGMPSAALAQTYTVSVEEVGLLPTAYQKRYNWRILPGYRHTTMIASSADPLACDESACLDDGEPGDQGPDGTRGGTATAIVGAMVPGVYQLELRYNQTVNRSTAVPWTVTTDAATNNSRSGTLNQRDTTPGANNWLVLGNSSSNPIAVASTLTFVFGSTTTNFNGSLSYGGIRLVKLEEGAGGSGGGGVVPDGGTPEDPACVPLRSREYDAAPVVLDEAAGSAVRLTFTIDDVPAPTGITSARLTMTLLDADHPGEEGLVYVNGHEGLALPADPSWNDATADAVLALPPAHLVAGTNVVEFGVGSRPTTHYAVSRVALELFGPGCGAATDAGAGGSNVGGADAGASPVGGASGDGAGPSGASGGTGPTPSASTNADADGGCGCVTRPQGPERSALALVVLAGVAVTRRRGRR